MSKELYFISLISEAISFSNNRFEMKKYLERIIELGNRPQYNQGFVQFKRFMAKVFETHQGDVSWLDGVWEEDAPKETIRLLIAKDGKTIASFKMRFSKKINLIHNTLPGLYTIRLSTGWVLWNDQISKKELLWREAFPDRELKLAAADGEVKRVPTKEISILDGEIVIRIFPGFEDGTIELMRRR